ncbi:MAG: phosphate transport system regulatory protein PhoU [Ignavibacteria bacterium RBG_13_36_8]|nr:MAG: phosphate transport system regulatory protein PhoU [Ignavibacteria bacterium RBG_13_36_8]
MERQFDLNIEKLRTRIIKMCSLVDEQVELALKAIEDDNPELSKIVTERDKKVNKYDRKVEKICQKIIALNQPVAMDLRLIMSALTISTNLERVGDLAKNISYSFIDLKRKPDFISETKYFEMARLAKEMLGNSIDAFNDGNLELAKGVILKDDELDELYSTNRRMLIDTMKKNVRFIEDCVNLLEISRQLERIGDHATNIAEDVYFIIEAQLIKHKYEKYLTEQLDEGDTDDDEK